MYAAGFELDSGPCSVCAGRVKEGGATVVPTTLLSSLEQGRFHGLAIRCRLWSQGLSASVFVPWREAATLPRLQSDLAAMLDVDWCRDAPAFDRLADGLGPHRRWLDTSGFSVRGLPCPVDASWLPDAALFRRLGRQHAFTYQINITRRPASTEEQRLLRKHLARLDLLATESAWPQRNLQMQRRLIERRLASPWLVDELLACDSDEQCRALQQDLHDRLVEQGGPALAHSAAQSGAFDEFLLTGLDSDGFVVRDVVASAGRSVVPATLWALLAQRGTPDSAQAKLHGAFISHSSADAALARRLCGQLEAAGLRCWIAPRDIAAGSHYAEVIDDALRDARAIVVLMSAAGMASEHVLRELERAVHHGALVLPVWLADIEPAGAFSYLLSGCQWTDALHGIDEHAVIQRLLASLTCAR